MKEAGAELIDTNKMTVAEESGSSEGIVLRYELKADMAAYLSRLGPEAPVRSLKDIIEFNNRNKETELRYFGQNVLKIPLRRRGR